MFVYIVAKSSLQIGSSLASQVRSAGYVVFSLDTVKMTAML